jgi:hypothetical protein
MSVELMLPADCRVPDVAKLAGQVTERGHVRKDRYDGYHGKHGGCPFEMKKHREAECHPWQLGWCAVEQAGYKAGNADARDQEEPAAPSPELRTAW